MRIKCIANKHKDLEKYEYKALADDIFGRFNISKQHEYSLTVGEEYNILGMILFQEYLAYLTDSNGLILTAPCYLFEVTDTKKIPKNWHFRIVEKDENIYPFIQAIWGYEELCLDKQAYEKLIVEMEEESQRTYFRRKIELSKLNY